MSDPLLVFALEQESANLFNEYNVLYTGVGKFQACLSLYKKLASEKPKVVINLGTAGSNRYPRKSIVNPVQFVQRDVDVTALGFELFQVPFSNIPRKLDYGVSISGIEDVVCGTGDIFSVSETFEHYDIVDMEAYIFAYLCKEQDIPFVCLKYISDSADEEADQDWNIALKETAHSLKEILEREVLPQIF